MMISGFDFALPGDYLAGLYAQSQTQSTIKNADTALLAVTEQEGIDLQWLPATQVITGTSQVAFTLMITNTGNVNTTFDLSMSASPGAAVEIANSQILIPPQAMVLVMVWVDVSRNGVYALTATAESGTVQASDTATLTVSSLEPEMLEIYLPLIINN